MAFISLFAALTAAGAFFRLPIGAMPITLQFFFTAAAGLLLGARHGAWSQAVYVFLGLIGLPIFTQGGGFGYVLQPSFGFLLGLIPCAWIIGALGRRRDGAVWIALSCAAGLATLYLIGLPYMALILNAYLGKGMDLRAILSAGMLPYLPGDALKIAAIAALCPGIQKRLYIFDEFRR